MTVKVIANQRPQRPGRGNVITHSAEKLMSLIRAAEVGAEAGTLRMDERERAYLFSKG